MMPGLERTKNHGGIPAGTKNRQPVMGMNGCLFFCNYLSTDRWGKYVPMICFSFSFSPSFILVRGSL